MGNIKKGGLIEIPFGISFREIVEDFGGGTFSGNPVKAIQVGGPLGAFEIVTNGIHQWIMRHSLRLTQ
ncbi:MAG: hypothetical protein CM15mP51_13940 [Porticoccaceae bacterium]|nr:MAG: hypothetical protein CM15mP51_13940 [Porticoccaceae bacterium]